MNGKSPVIEILGMSMAAVTVVNFGGKKKDFWR